MLFHLLSFLVAVAPSPSPVPVPVEPHIETWSQLVQVTLDDLGRGRVDGSILFPAGIILLIFILVHARKGTLRG